jgi:hypothetical protein
MADANRQDPENLQNAEGETGGRPLDVGRSRPDDRPDDTYEPSTIQVNRGREQGLGVGQKDLDYQRDATRAPSSQQYSREPDGGGSRGQG